MKVELIAMTPDPEKVIENAGRTCYLSFDRAGPDSHKRFIRMLVRNGHHTVFEHAVATFRIKGVSRALTHQLVRHRLASFSQQSQRYVSEKDFEVVEPDTIRNKPEAHEIFEKQIEQARQAYRQLQEMGVKNEDARFVLPNAVCSEIVITANFREWRHIIGLRGAKYAQWEIRRLSLEILKILKENAPAVFEDFDIDPEDTVVTLRSL